MAQATISGSINVGIVDTGAAGASAAVASLGGGANAINIATTEDLGGGLRGGFNGQIRFNAANGNMNSSGTAVSATVTNNVSTGNLFHDANVFVGGGFGTVRIGKIAEASNCAFDPWACTGGAGLAGGVGISSLVAAGTQATSVSYTSPAFSGFSGSYQTTVSSRVNERSVLSLNYSQGPIAAQLLRVENSANTSAPGAAVPTDVKSTQQSIGASYNFGVARVSLVKRVDKNASKAKTADVTSLGVSVPMGAITLLGGYNKAKQVGTIAPNTTAADAAAATAVNITSANDTKISLGVNYALSKRTTLGADVFKAETAGASTGFVIRARHTF